MTIASCSAVSRMNDIRIRSGIHAECGYRLSDGTCGESHGVLSWVVASNFLDEMKQKLKQSAACDGGKIPISRRR